MTNDLTYPADAMRAANAEAERLRDELTRLKKQRRELWMLLDHIDTLDDACRDHDDAFRNFARKHQKRRFEIWNPESDAEFDEEKALALGAIDTESVRENRRLADIVNKKRAGVKNVPFSESDLLIKYDQIVKYWPANTLDIFVKRLTGTLAQYVITNRPQSATELFNTLKTTHGDREEAEYEIKIVDANTREFRGVGRIVIPDARSTPASRGTHGATLADIREHKPARENVRSGLKTLLVQARQIWGENTFTLDHIVIRLMVGVGDIARLCRNNPLDVLDEPRIAEVKKELGNVLFSTIRWIDDLELDPLECLDLAIETQEKIVKRRPQ